MTRLPAKMLKVRGHSATFTGKNGVRVQLRVYDTRHPTMNPHGEISFRVSVLRPSEEKSTSFSSKRARRVYFGRDEASALDAASEQFGLEIDPTEDFPPTLAAYFAEVSA